MNLKLPHVAYIHTAEKLLLALPGAWRTGLILGYIVSILLTSQVCQRQGPWWLGASHLPDSLFLGAVRDAGLSCCEHIKRACTSSPARPLGWEGLSFPLPSRLQARLWQVPLAKGSVNFRGMGVRRAFKDNQVLQTRVHHNTAHGTCHGLSLRWNLV